MHHLGVLLVEDLVVVVVHLVLVEWVVEWEVAPLILPRL
jgi:hypothetical protein